MSLNSVIMPPPLASLSSLPLEIKAIVVQFAFMQDQAYFARVRSDPNQHIKELNGIRKPNRWRGRSLNCLFLLNLEFSALAAVHLFRNLPAHSVASPIFKFIVLGRRSNLITTLVLTRSNPPADILSYASAFINLTSIIFSKASSTSLFGVLDSFPTVSLDLAHQFHLNALQSFRHRIRNLTFHDHTRKQLSYLLEYFHNVKSVQLFGVDSLDDKHDDTRLLGVSLASLSSIEVLSIEKLTASWPPSWSQLDWSRSHLRRIELVLDFITVEELDFISSFSVTLEDLKISGTITGFSPLYELPHALIKLNQLSMVADFNHLIFLLKLFVASPLVFLTLETNDSDEFYRRNLKHPLQSLVRGHKNLKSIEFIDRVSAFDRLPDLVALCAKKKILLKFSVWEDQLENRPDLLLSPLEEFRFRIPILEKSLAAGMNKLKLLKDYEDVEGLKEMFDNCKWLRASAAEMMD